jgi:hypothetical protein
MAPMSNQDRARSGASALHAGRTPEQRSAAASHAYLSGAVNTVCKRWSDLTDAQRAQVRELACS